MARRAGFLSLGNDLVTQAIKDEEAQMIFVDSASSSRQMDDLTQLANKKEIPLVDLFTEEEISKSIGANRKVVSLNNQGIAREIKKILEEN